jgi:glycosyltransferase involved in cell wall biosynthesis
LTRINVHFSATSYPEDLADWRGIFIRHMAFALARSEHVELNMWTPPGEFPPGARTQIIERDSLWLKALMDEGGLAHLLRTRRISAAKRVIELLYRLNRAYRTSSDHDLYHLNWLQTALPLPKDGRPALITVLGTDMNLLGLPFVKMLLRRVMRHRQVMLCPNAEWMVSPLTNALGDLAGIETVAFGIDPVWYEIQRSPPAADPTWIVVTRLTRGKLGPLFSWTKPLFQGSNRQLHLFGPMQEEIEVPDWVSYHGPVTPDELSNRWFPQAQGLITLSQHAEGRPQIMLEAMAAGIPIIASDIDAHQNLIKNGITGRLCSSPAEFAESIDFFEDPEKNREYGRNAREWVTSRMGTWDDCANRYIKIYNRLLDGNIA